MILRGGFGGSSVADELAAAPVRHTLIMRANHHRFHPLLYELITAGFAFSENSATIRVRRGKQQHTTVLIGEAISIDLDLPRKSGRVRERNYAAFGNCASYSAGLT